MPEQKEWQTEHAQVISSFLGYLNEHTNDFILKGGTALMTCYGPAAARTLPHGCI